jgi:hypothetical protein
MRMRILDRRMHLLLDESRYQKANRIADRQGVSVAEVIRQAIDALPEDTDRRRVAIDAILAAPPITVPSDPADLRRELDDARGRAGW